MVFMYSLFDFNRTDIARKILYPEIFYIIIYSKNSQKKFTKRAIKYYINMLLKRKEEKVEVENEWEFWEFYG